MRRPYGHPLRNTPAVRRARAVAFQPQAGAQTGIADDIRLFAMFFLGGLTFMTVYLA